MLDGGLAHGDPVACACGFLGELGIVEGHAGGIQIPACGEEVLVEVEADGRLVDLSLVAHHASLQRGDACVEIGDIRFVAFLVGFQIGEEARVGDLHFIQICGISQNSKRRTFRGHAPLGELAALETEDAVFLGADAVGLLLGLAILPIRLLAHLVGGVALHLRLHVAELRLLAKLLVLVGGNL